MTGDRSVAQFSQLPNKIEADIQLIEDEKYQLQNDRLRRDAQFKLYYKV